MKNKLSLNSKTPKPRVRFVSPPKPHTPVDELARQYVSFKEQEKSAGVQAEQVNAQIKELAARQGKLEGKSKLLYGNRYVIGFSETAPAPVVDVEKLRKLVKFEHFKYCTKTVVVVNEQHLVELVESDVIPREKFLKCLVDSGKSPTKRVYVASLADHKRNQQKSKDAQ